jgi:phosphate transport system protein
VPRKTFHDELKELQKSILEMGNLTLKAIRDAVNTVVNCDLKLADSVIDLDDSIDALNIGIEENALALIARQAPVAKDLRLCFSVIFIATHLERMADLAVNIARGAKRVCPTEGVSSLLKIIAEMGNLTDELVKACLKAFKERDLQLAESLGEMDEPIDDLFKKFFKELVKYAEDESMEWFSNIVLAGRYLERIADHAVDIGERVTYLVTGQTKELD